MPPDTFATCAPSRASRVLALAALVGVTLAAGTAAGQPAESSPPTRAEVIAAAQADKARVLRPHQPGPAERLVTKAEQYLVSGVVRWHPFFGTPYQGAGLTLGAGYLWHLGDIQSLDVRGSRSLTDSTRVEAEFRAPRLFDGRGQLSVLGGWRDGREIPLYGIGPEARARSGRTRFDVRQAFTTATLDVRPWRGALALHGGAGYARVEQVVDAGSVFARRYQTQPLPGLGATIDYLQSRGGVAFDWRPAAGYARRGGAYGVTVSRFDDRDGPYSFRQVDYDVVQHVPLFRDAWVLSLRGRAETTYASDGELVPFFMMPTLGNGTTLRGFASGRFRDRHSLLLSGEWRILLNSVVDAALFYDAGKVAARRADLDLRDLERSYGIGFRFHSLSATPFRLDLARSREGMVLVVGATAAF